jgi:broad specificity phosphatase PhoE
MIDVGTEFIVFRHGETDWNRSKRLQGHTDIPLNETGRSQAAELKEKIKDIYVDGVLSSDLARALETAKIVFSERNILIQASGELREMRLGDVEGRLLSDMTAHYGRDLWERWRSVSKEDLDFSFPKGETKREHLFRMQSFLGAQALKLKATRLAVSTHGGSLRALVHGCENAPSTPIAIPNCSAYRILLKDGEWIFLGCVVGG